MSILLAACAMAVTVNIKPPVDADAILLDCIAQVENGPRWNRTNISVAAGWPHITPRKRLEQIREELTGKGYVPTVYLLALAWNAGVARIEARDERRRHRDYAERVRNLVEERMAALSK